MILSISLEDQYSFNLPKVNKIPTASLFYAAFIYKKECDY